jgi:hypothetical protein
MSRNDYNSYGVNPGVLVKIGGVCLLIIAIASFFFIWFACRIQPNSNQLAIKIMKDGQNLTNDQFLAPSLNFKGVQQEDIIRGPSRTFVNPYYTEWMIFDAIEVPEMKALVLTRKYGDPLPAGETIARTDNQKGVLEKTLGTGLHWINLAAYDYQVVDIVNIDAGHVGIVAQLAGELPENPNVFVVEKGKRGLQPYLLNPGIHPEYSNPYAYKVIKIETRSRKLETTGQEKIIFPSKDGFDITSELVIEWAPILPVLPETLAKYSEQEDISANGGLKSIEYKLVLSFARSYMRIVGGNHYAGDYITGTTRMSVQEAVFQKLKTKCLEEGVEIRSFVLRSTEPPQSIRDQYSRREIAKRQTDMLNKQIETQIGTPIIVGGTVLLDSNNIPVKDEFGNPVIVGGTPKLDDKGKIVREGGRLSKLLMEQEAKRNAALGDVRTQIAQLIRQAEQYREVSVTEANNRNQVATITLSAAKNNAGQITAKGFAEAAVVVMNNKAEALGISETVSAFGSGEKYAENLYISKFAPAVKTIWSNTDGPFIKMFDRFSESKEKSATSK